MTSVVQNTNNVIRQFMGVKITQRVDGYFDATAMCKATGKRWPDYRRLDNTQAFIDALSSDVHIPTSELIQSVKGGHSQSQGTWVHPQVAINLAQWCSPYFAVLVTKWVFELMTTGRVELQARPSGHKMLEHARVNKELMALFGIDGNMQTLALNNALKKEFGVDLLESWGVSGLKSETQEQVFTPSDIAERLDPNLNARKVNLLLIEAGLQSDHRDHKDRLYYELTEAGQKHGLYLDTGKKHKTDGTPVRQLKWYSSAIDVLKAHLENAFEMTGGVA